MDETVIHIKGALLVATMDDEGTRVDGGDVLVRGRTIEAVGKDLPVPEDSRVIDARGCVVLPGFVNTHHHLYQTFTRCVPAVQDAELFDWLLTLYGIWKHISPLDVEISAQVGLGELLLTGCTTTSDHFYLFPRSQPGDLFDRTVEAARAVGIRFHPTRGSMSLGRSAGGLPPDEVVQTEDEIMADCERVVARYHDPEPLSMCRVGLAPCSPFSVTPELMKASIEMARRNGLLCHTHLAETLDEETFCIERFGKRPVAYIDELGWMGEDVWYAHAVHLNEDEIDLIARTGTGVSHCPTSNLRLGSGISPVPALLARGAAVGLGVDGSASNDSSDMLGELRSCLLVHRIQTGVTSMVAERVLRMATRGGARVLNRPDLGSLEPGKAADLVCWDVSGLGYAGALHDPQAALLFAGDSHIARTVLVNGRVVVEEGRLTCVDERALAEKANDLSHKLLGAR